MAQLIVHNPPTVKLKASGYTGTPTGDIELTENNRTYNVSSYATATTNIPEPSGTKEIVENGNYNVKDFEFADVNVPQPTGDIELTENNRTYNVSPFATATVKVPVGIPIDEGSQTPLYFGVHASGFVLSSNPADETPVAFGVDANNHPYVKGGTT